ncbi:MAG: phage major capsid protein [Terrisporobacter othiniensis]|uniref:phage major capsid protein n=1 Tax=Terrisporobacter othiniensis TaxID=1577792 RepID=UPI002A74B8FB|nr:phage major capsid protein [Terrisporobacter othiniensis]MDY3372065.1 phage major capsid protein [Terrisporobacter othiniensis]
MNKKQLKEQRAKLEKTKNILMQKDIEQRSDKQRKTIEELSDQIRAIDNQLDNLKRETRKVEVNNMDKNMEQRKALEGFIRTKECRDLNTSNAGAVIPNSISEEIVEKLDETAPLFGRVRKLTPQSGKIEILKEKEIGQAGFFGEGEDLDISDFEFEKVKLEQRRAGTVIKMSQKLVNDSGIDIVDYANNLLVRRLAKTLDKAMILGTVEKEEFEGLVNAPVECEVAPLGGEVGIDDYMNCLNAMHPTLQDKAIWVVSRTEFNKLSLLKDAIGNYYLTRDIIDGKPQYRLFGCEVCVSDDMAEVEGVQAYLVNVEEAFGGIIKKDMELKHINADTQNALRGSVTMLLDIYADVKIKNEQAIRVLKSVA